MNECFPGTGSPGSFWIKGCKMGCCFDRQFSVVVMALHVSTQLFLYQARLVPRRFIQPSRLTQPYQPSVSAVSTGLATDSDDTASYFLCNSKSVYQDWWHTDLVA